MRHVPSGSHHSGSGRAAGVRQDGRVLSVRFVRHRVLVLSAESGGGHAVGCGAHEARGGAVRPGTDGAHSDVARCAHEAPAGELLGGCIIIIVALSDLFVHE